MSTPQQGSYHEQTDPDADVAQMMGEALPALVGRDADWEQVQRLVPLDLEEVARASRAIRGSGVPRQAVRISCSQV